MTDHPLDRLRYHVTGAIKRGEGESIVGITPLQAVMQAAVAELDRAQSAGAPVQIAIAREKALIDGLMGLAAQAGADIERPPGIDSRGELSIFGKMNPQGSCGPYGERFAAILSEAATRAGMQPGKWTVLPENGWCFINHFELERLIRRVAVDPDFEAEQLNNYVVTKRGRFFEGWSGGRGKRMLWTQDLNKAHRFAVEAAARLAEDAGGKYLKASEARSPDVDSDPAP